MNIKAKGLVSIPNTPRTLVGLLPWSKSVNRALQQLRDRTWTVPRSGGGGGAASSTYVPWKPTFFTEGTAPSVVYKCRFNLGTLNNICASNWDYEHTLPSNGVKFVILEIAASSGKVTGLEIVLENSPPIEDIVLMDTPPPNWRILLGVVDKQSSSMIVHTNLNATASEVYRQSKVVTTVGGEPFSRYWRWNHVSV
jgi:hypothetical protein